MTRILLSLLLMMLAAQANAIQMNALTISASAVYVTATTGTVSATNVYAQNLSATTVSGNGSLVTNISPSITGVAYVSADTFIDSTIPAGNHGVATTLTLGANDAVLVYFDLPPLSAGVTAVKVRAAYLNLYCNSSIAFGTIGVYPITSSWTESAATWNTSPTIGALITTAAMPANNKLLVVDISSTVQAWFNGTLANNGVMIQQISTAAGTFRSRKFVGAGMVPTLTVW